MIMIYVHSLSYIHVSQEVTVPIGRKTFDENIRSRQVSRHFVTVFAYYREFTELYQNV